MSVLSHMRAVRDACPQGFAASYVGEYLKDTGTAEKFNVGEYWVDLRCVRISPAAQKSCHIKHWHAD